MTKDSKPPKGLRDLDQWVNWNANKVPHPAINTPLLSYADAVKRNRTRVGFVFTTADPYAGIDIDDMTPLAQELLSEARRLGAWRQRSPSGRGWHIIGHGHLPHGIGKGSADTGVEAYSQGRYFTVPDEVEGGDVDVSIQPLLDRLWTLYQTKREGAGMARGPQWDPATHQSALDAVSSDCDRPTWVMIGMALHAGGASLATFIRWSARAQGLGSDGRPRYQGHEDCERVWASFHDGDTTLGTLLAAARRQGWGETGGTDAFEVVEEPEPEPEPEPNPWEALAIDVARHHRPVPPREWAWQQWIPRKVVTGIAGPPGVAKSTLALQLCVLHCLGDEYLGQPVGIGGALFVTVEDDDEELIRRLQRIAAGHFIDTHDIEGLRMVSATSAPVKLVSVDRDGGLSATQLLKHLRQWIREQAFKFIVLDLVGDFWDGNENSRGEVSGYVRGYLARLAKQTGAAVVVISHLNKLGVLSGSTAWEGSYRSCIVLSPAEQDRIALLRTKANYAPRMEIPRLVTWSEGYLREVMEEEVDAEQLLADQARLDAMQPGEWYRIRALAQLWVVPQAEVRGLVARLESLHSRRHGGSDEWMRG